MPALVISAGSIPQNCLSVTLPLFTAELPTSAALTTRLYAIEADPDVSQLPLQADSSGQSVRVNNRVRWVFEAKAGFETNPLVSRRHGLCRES